MNAFQSILRILGRVIGLASASIGERSLEHMVRRRMADMGDADYEAYLLRLKRSPEEVRRLIETVVVPETWFFREPAAFALLKDVARRGAQERGVRGPQRILSLGCATGEEPYSIAMALFDAGLDAVQFQILGMDISRQALGTARAGRYGPGSFRAADLGFRSRWFSAEEHGYRLLPRVLSAVEFVRGNILHPIPGHQDLRFDVIFFRNVLIYLSASARALVMARLREVLTPDGLIFAGHAEAGLYMAAGFRRSDVPRTFAFTRGGEPKPRLVAAAPRRVTAAPMSATPIAIAASPSAPPFSAPSRLPAPQPKPKPKPTDPITTPPMPQAVSTGDLDVIRAMADRGQLEQAADLCQHYLDQHPEHTDGLFLLGLVRAAGGNSEAAAAAYRKVLYLDPGHVQALLQMAMMAERRGDGAQATRLRQRARARMEPSHDT